MTMADDDLDLDAMLDSVLDGGFPSAASAAESGKESHALGATASKFTIAAHETKGSGQCTQGQRPTDVVSAAKEPWAFLPDERREIWEATLEKDAKRQAEMEKQRPLSRAYRSFHLGKDDDGIVVHLGSGAAGGGASSTANDVDTLGGRKGPRDADERKRAVDIFEEVFTKGVSNSGVNEPPVVGQEDYHEFDRLKASYLRLVVRDVRARIRTDPDVDPVKFPAIATKILA